MPPKKSRQIFAKKGFLKSHIHIVKLLKTMRHLIIEDFVDSWSLQKIKENLNKAKEVDWEDGKKTNLDHNGKVNSQLFANTEIYQNIFKIVNLSITNNTTFQSYTLIKYLFGCLLTRTGVEGKYGKHLDVLYRTKNPNTNDMVRSDLSFTLFLNDPEEYEGGYLSIQNMGEFKLRAGSMLIYPSNEIHEVTEVTSGERYVFIGWIESQVKNIIHRNLIYDFSKIMDDLTLSEEKFREVQKFRYNLLREFVG
jgi:PKHD-type hydroxylase